MSSRVVVHSGRFKLDNLGCGDSFYDPNFLSSEDSEMYWERILHETAQSYEEPENMTFSIFGKTVLLPRRKAFWGDVTTRQEKGITKVFYPLYRYGGKYEPVVNDWNPAIQEIRDRLDDETGQYCNHCVQNLYQQGDDYIGLHRDKTRDFVKGTSVMTVSLGGVRIFRLEADDGSECVDIQMRPGSLFCLGPATNARYKHSILKTNRAVDPRISLTFRSIATMGERTIQQD